MKQFSLRYFRTALVPVLALLAWAGRESLLAQDLKPQLVGLYPARYFYIPNSVTVAGSRAYMTYDYSGSVKGAAMMIYDITDPLAVQCVATNSVSVGSYVTVRSNLAYVSTSSALAIYDLTDETAPNQISSLSVISGSSGKFVLDGNYGYIDDGGGLGGGLSVLDLSNPAAPRRLTRIRSAAEITTIFVSGHYAYLSEIVQNTSGLLEIIDISNPASPTKVGSYPMKYPLFSVLVSGNTAYLGGGNGEPLALINVQNPQSPQAIGTYNAGPIGVVAGNRACFYGGGLQVLDVSFPQTPQRLGGYAGFCWGVSVSGRYAYVGRYENGVGGLGVIDLAPPANVRRIGGAATPGSAIDICLSGTRAFIADAQAGLQVLEISNAWSPLVLGASPTANPADSVVSHGDYAYVLDNVYVGMSLYRRVLHIVDASNPAAPKEVGAYRTSTYNNSAPMALAPNGDFAFLVTRPNFSSPFRIEIVDIRTPTNSSLVKSYNLTVPPNAMANYGNYLLVGQNGLLVLDITDPTNPQTVGTYNSSQWVNHLAISGNRAYLAGSGGVEIVDLSDPTNPVTISQTTDFGMNWSGLAVSSNYLFGAAGAGGLEIADISDPTNPRFLGGNSAVVASAVTVSNGHVYVAGQDEGLQVFEAGVTTPTTPAELKLGLSGSTLTVSWSASLTGAILESTDLLSPTATWSPAPEAPILTGDKYVVTVADHSQGARFFRLRIQ